MTTPITTKPSSIASRLKSFGVVHAALTIHSGEAVHVLGQRKTAALGPGPEVAAEATLQAEGDTSYRELFSHLASELQMAKTEMISTNTVHLGQLAQVGDLKGRRDGLKGALASRFKQARQTFETFYGADQNFPVLAISGDTPSDPTGLVAQVRDTVGFLQVPKVATPPLDLLGVELDPPAIAAQLAANADELDGVLVDVNEAEKQADVTRGAKNGAIKAYDRKFLRVARLAESAFHFAGMHELATRVRPSTRRPGRRLADENGESDTQQTDTQQTDSGQPNTQQANTAQTDSQPAQAPPDTSEEAGASPIDA